MTRFGFPLRKLLESGPPVCGTLIRVQVRNRIDERDVRKRLREISRQALFFQMIFLRQQPDIVLKPD